MKIWLQAIWLGGLLWLAAIMTVASDQQVKVYPIYTGLAQSLAVNDNDQPVTITVRGPRWALIGTTSASFSAEADFNQTAAPGVAQASFTVKALKNHLAVTDAPSTLQKEIVQAASKTVPARVVFTGYPSKGYTVKDFSLDSQQVEVVGAPAILERIAEVTVPIDVTGRQDNVSGEVKVISNNLDNVPRHNIVFHPGILKLEVRIAKGESFATFGIQPVLTSELPDGLIVKHVIVEPEVVTLRGDAALLARFTTLKTTPISLNNKFGDFTEEAGLEIPPGLQLEGNNLVSVRILLTTLFQVKSLTVTPQFTNLAEGLSVGRIEPQTVKVNIVGKPEVLDKILAKDIQLVVDLRGTISGIQDVALKSGDFALAVDGASLASFEPASLKLQITKD
jgi:YbbR domain-containing protein